MRIRAIKDLVNARLAGEQLPYSTLLPYLDSVVDEINSKLHAKFKTFSQVSPRDIDVEYNEFPDKYIRTVVAVGAAARWYIDDEEGIETATALTQQYNNNLFVMMRDYGPLVPADKQAEENTGYLADPNDLSSSGQGINPEIRYIEVVGPPGTSIEGFEVVSGPGGKHLYARLVDYKYGTKVIDCGIITTEVITMKLDAAGNLVAVFSDGSTHIVGNIPNFLNNYLQVEIPGTGGSTAGTNTIKFVIED